MGFSETKIKCFEYGSIGIIELDRPSALNALDTSMLHSIETNMRRWMTAPEIRCVFMHSDVSKAFCAGGDVKRLILDKHQTRSIDAGIEFFNQEYFTDCLVHQYTKPVIAWLEGITMGGGLGLANGATIRIATESSVFAMPEVYIGFFPDVGGSRFLAKIEDNAGFYLGMSGDRIDAYTALAMGLVDAILPREKKSLVVDYAEKFDFTPQKATHRTRFLNSLSKDMNVFTLESAKVSEYNLLKRLQLLQSPFYEKWKILEKAFNPLHNFKDMRAAIQKMDNKRRRCVQSQAIAFELIRSFQLQTPSWRNVFEREWLVAIELLKGDNFSEGVRAVLIDKDQHPDWPPVTEDEALKEARELLGRSFDNQLAKKFTDASKQIRF